LGSHLVDLRPESGGGEKVDHRRLQVTEQTGCQRKIHRRA
jgi:hypothetical protein